MSVCICWYKLFNGIHQLLFADKGRSALPGANNCQGQLKTPQSVSVVFFFFFNVVRKLTLKVRNANRQILRVIEKASEYPEERTILFVFS
jgi:hypothetical protein